MTVAIVTDAANYISSVVPVESFAMSEDVRYPVGKWRDQPAADAATLIGQIAAAPANLVAAVTGLTDAQLDTPYREGGWTSRQIVHHIADSHMNAYVRFKLGVTEDNPAIKPYNEKLWAETADGKTAPVAVSLTLVDNVHTRMVQFLRSLDPPMFSRKVMHPENGPMSLSDLLQLYAWHGRHHTAHITGLRQSKGW
jgi:uncharacterized damage-inducible protein DinB